MLRSILAASLLAMNAPPPTPTDYTVCGKVHNGPIERPDGYSDNLYARKPDLA